MEEISPQLAPHRVVPSRFTRKRRSVFEWRVVDIARDMSRSQAQSLLTEHAEYGQWELARSVKFVGGARRVWLRRRAMIVERTDVTS